jgi:hypothetical protein
LFTLLVLYIGANLVLALLALPLLAGKVKPNPFYGFRVAKTLEDPVVWYAVNRFFARYQLAAALIGLSASVALYFWPGITVDTYALACLGVFMLAFGFAVFKGWRYLKQIA